MSRTLNASLEETLVENILLAVAENGGTFPNMEHLSEAQQKVVKCILDIYQIDDKGRFI